jgi:sirohydrochlorin ferrochelatase
MTASAESAALIVFAHGSSVESANHAVRIVANQVAERGGYETVQAAFLEGGRPNLREAVEIVAGLGHRRVVILPYFLTLGLHLQRDLPRLIEGIQGAYQELSIEVTPPLDTHPALVDALIDRAKESACKPS